jgi:hypothetical protein
MLDLSGELGVHGRIIIKRILNEESGSSWSGFIRLRTEMAFNLRRSIKFVEFLTS